jgi:hypothetical protein
MIQENLDDLHYALAFKPNVDDNGDMSIGVGLLIRNPQDEDRVVAGTILMMLMLSAAFVMINEDDEFYDVVMDRLYALRNDSHPEGFLKKVLETLDDEDTVSYEYTDEDKKVIKLNFNTKTEGTA